MKRWRPLYLLGIILMAIVVFVGAILSFLGFTDAASRGRNAKEFWRDFLEDFNWQEFPWENFPFDMLEDFPWDTLPWDDLPENFDWNSIPWENLPENFPWEKLPWKDPPENFPWDRVPWNDVAWDRVPWDEIPEDFPWEKVPWEELPEDFPWEDVPWSEAPPELWEDFPWTELPENFPWQLLPWLAIPPALVPDDAFPEDFYPEAWEHEHVFSGDWVLVSPATCGAAGEEINECILCKRTIHRAIEPTNLHTFDEEGICGVCHVRRLILMSESKSAQYSGEPLVGDSVPVFLAGSASLLEGHMLNTAGLRFAKCRELGKAVNSFYFVNKVCVIDGAGRDVSSQYYVEKVFGTLELTKREIVLRTKTKQKKYDGTPLSGDEGKPDDYTVEGLVGGDRLVDVVFGESVTDRGMRRQNEIVSFRIVNAAGEDVTGNYAVQVEWGWLIVTP